MNQSSTLDWRDIIGILGLIAAIIELVIEFRRMLKGRTLGRSMKVVIVGVLLGVGVSLLVYWAAIWSATSSPGTSVLLVIRTARWATSLAMILGIVCGLRLASLAEHVKPSEERETDGDTSN
jgi:threonine/homoserine/homoserine lactone efflux protein